MGKTYTITQQEYKDFFSKDITVRQKEKLAAKIFHRMKFLGKLFKKAIPFYSIEDLCINFYRDNYLWDNNSHGISSGSPNDLLPVRALWDDQLVAKLQELKRQQELDKEKEEQNIIDSFVSIFDKLTEKEIQHLENTDCLKMALHRRKKYFS